MPDSDPSANRQTAEHLRLAEAKGGVPWQRWGPYLAERQWATVREDYSPYGTAWDWFPHDHARSRAYRWGEDGLLGISDEDQHLCLALSLWNGHDAILKERLYGLTGTEGNHSEDVKEYYFYLDSTPTHSFMRALYKYPQRAYPYQRLVDEGRARSRLDPEFELLDTGIFDDGRYFDVEVTYAKAGPDDILMRTTATNRGPDPAPIHLIPTLWFRNTWSWAPGRTRPNIEARADGDHRLVRATHETLGDFWLAASPADDAEVAHGHNPTSPALLFCDNDTNAERFWGMKQGGYAKDGINDAIVNHRTAAVNPNHHGTKVAAHYAFTLAPGESRSVTVRLARQLPADPFADAGQVFEARQREADAFYAGFGGESLTHDELRVQRQAFAGLLWSKQYYEYDVERWLAGDPAQPKPPPERLRGRNYEWRHLNNSTIMSMPDTWEYPWYAAWDLAFHCIPLALVDPEFAKHQLVLLLREWYMHPNGQIPAYEWAFGDVNPPVHAWAAFRVYKIEKRLTGTGDRAFLERVFQKLLLNFTWWVNRKDSEGLNVFQGGFLGLDNIGVFDRSANLPTGGHLEQADGTAWMGMYCLNMLAIALELAQENHTYEDVATKFFEHFLYIAGAMNNIGGEHVALWDEDDEFFYDVLHAPDGTRQRLKVRSLVGLIPLLAVEVIEPSVLAQLPEFRKRLEWFLANRPQLAGLVSRWHEAGVGERRLLALVRGHRMKRLLARMLDPEEFLGDYGVRSLSRYHRDHPFMIEAGGQVHIVRYEPAESTSGLFGGNSNWRGPVWFPLNYLLIESLQKFHHYFGDDFLVEFPTRSGSRHTLWEISSALSRRLSATFLRDANGRRPVYGGLREFQEDPHWRDHILFYEYFHGDNGAGLGASHQTGWTALVAKLLEQSSHDSAREWTLREGLANHPGGTIA